MLCRLLLSCVIATACLPVLAGVQTGVGARAAEAAPPTPEQFQALLEAEVQRLDRAMNDRMGLALMRTDDPVVQHFVASGVLRIPPEAYERLGSGLAAVVVVNGEHNGRRRAMCYVLFNPERAGPSRRAFFDSIALATGDPRQGAAYLAAHEVGHCLDHMDREESLAASMKWNARQAEQAGVAPVAFARVFGKTVATGAYRARTPELYADLAQRQYEERVADAFGVLWTWRLGGGEAVLEKVHAVRNRNLAHNAHATAPTLAALPALKPALAQTEGLAQVWALARQVQRHTGVDASLGPGSTVAHNPQPTGRGNTESTGAPALVPQSKAWNELPRFGAPRR